jgi:hypothetical protein
MERLAARGWHNAVSPPLGLREVAHAQIPGAHALVLTIIFSRLKVRHPGVYRLFARGTW